MATARRAAVLALLLGLGPGLAPGCGRRAAAPAAPLRDEIGHEVALRTRPARRIISLAANTTEILYAMGAGDRLVGVDLYSDYPPEAARLPRVGNETEPSVEKILALRPDVVVTATTANPRALVEALERLGVPVYVTRTGSTAELEQTIVDLGALCGAEPGAAALRARLHADLAAVRARAAALPPTPTLVVVWNDPLFVVGQGTFPGDLLTIAGGRNVAEDAGAGFPKVSLERVLRRAPGVLILGSHANPGASADPMAYWQRWPELPAVRDRRVYAIDGDLVFRPGPRAAAGARALFGLLHPDLDHGGPAAR